MRLQSTWLLIERRRPNVPFQTSRIRRNDKEWFQSTPFERFVGESVHCDHPPMLQIEATKQTSTLKGRVVAKSTGTCGGTTKES